MNMYTDSPADRNHISGFISGCVYAYNRAQVIVFIESYGNMPLNKRTEANARFVRDAGCARTRSAACIAGYARLSMQITHIFWSTPNCSIRFRLYGILLPGLIAAC